ncbi:hypothetical protein NM688_g6337 [Phlebia brevispora]|uniref:Uncharacterized protein n=1 Tax=Phlebia brevispora TaxID=194682 RepID=A0ACC1SH70_9APHY|nr:hypothetical protein NM688_g6337 [Phlebia brevispora]
MLRELIPVQLISAGVQLTVGSASVLSDVFTIEWGLRKLVFKECDLDEPIIKPILHSLTIPGTLTFLSVASNRRLKAGAFRLIGAYLCKAKRLQFLDLSQNVLDKKSIEYIAQALSPVSEPGLVSLRLDDCSLKPQALDALAHSVRVSSLRNISLRHNKINATGAVAVALMIRDYPDRFPTTNGSTSPSSTSPASSTTALVSPPQTPSVASSPISFDHPPTPPPRLGPILPPPRHPSTIPQTTYTPYIPRSRRGAATSASPSPSNTNPLSPTGQQIPIITSSAQGGITTRHPVPPPPTPTPNGHGPSAALLDKVRALDALPRLGALKTLDLRGNDIRNGISYIAQVLKRNRTLKVLNLSENKLDVQCLVSIAEALVQSLRTAFTLNNALKRLFLSSTNLTSTGAIALAEFLPESTSLLHLDLTLNNLDLAGVMALSSGLKANHVMRCLDLNIPPGDEEMARMCRDILNTCVRNTEEAEKASHPTHIEAPSGRGQGKGLWVMIEESELAKTFRQDEQKKVEAPISDAAPSLALPEDDTDQVLPSVEQKDSDVIVQARACKEELDDYLARSPSSSTSPVSPSVQLEPEVEKRAKGALKSIGKLIETTTDDPARLEELLSLNDELAASLSRFKSPAGMGWKRIGLGIHINIGEERGDVIPNGHAPTEDGEPPVTPRIDKGKGRAEPEPEHVEKVLSPTLDVPESESEDGEADVVEGQPDDIVSPTDRSRSWVAEEGEVFRKGAVLLTAEEMEGEYDSEELRKELLEAMVERPPPRMLHDGFDDIAGTSPISPVASPVEQKKPPPRPYIRRSRSSENSVNSPRSPVIPPPFREPI